MNHCIQTHMYNIAPLSARNISPSLNLTTNICDSSPDTVDEVVKSIQDMAFSSFFTEGRLVEKSRRRRRALGRIADEIGRSKSHAVRVA